MSHSTLDFFFWRFLADATRRRPASEPRELLAAKAQALVQAGARDLAPPGELPFIFNAIMADDHDLVTALAHSFDPATRDEHGLTALGLASALGHPLCAAPLLSVCDPSIPDRQGRTPLARAAKAGCVSIASMLLPLSDPMAPDRAGNLALHGAMGADPASVAPMASLLLGAAPQSVQVRNHAGATAWDLAVSRGLGQACLVLLAFQERQDIKTLLQCGAPQAAAQGRALEKAL